MVTCLYCHASVTKSEETVQAAWFREAYQRVYGSLERPAQTVQFQAQTYGILQRLGRGTHSDIYLAERISPLPERVILKLALEGSTDSESALKRAAHALDALQQSSVQGSPYFTQRLPQPVAIGVAHGFFTGERTALVLRSAPGYWGSLADVMHCYRSKAQAVDVRHVVWMWRRVLEVLAFVHDSGWVHQDLVPENLLVHPTDHGVQIIGWSHAENPGRDSALCGQDLTQIAWALRALLCGGEDPTTTTLPNSVPAPLIKLLIQCESASWCTQFGARGIDQALRTAALEAFGAPRFIRFDPQP